MERTREVKEKPSKDLDGSGGGGIRKEVKIPFRNVEQGVDFAGGEKKRGGKRGGRNWGGSSPRRKG